MTSYVLLSNMYAPDFEQPLVAVWRSGLFDELTALEDMLFAGRALPLREPGIDADGQEAVMSGFLAQIPDDATGLGGLSLPVLHQSPGHSFVHRRLRQAIS